MARRVGFNQDSVAQAMTSSPRSHRLARIVGQIGNRGFELNPVGNDRDAFRIDWSRILIRSPSVRAAACRLPRSARWHRFFPEQRLAGVAKQHRRVSSRPLSAASSAS